MSSDGRGKVRRDETSPPTDMATFEGRRLGRNSNKSSQCSVRLDQGKLSLRQENM